MKLVLNKRVLFILLLTSAICNQYPSSSNSGGSHNNPNPLLYYQTETGQLYGPYPQQQLEEWYHQGYFNMQTLVSESAQGPFAPLTSYMHQSHEVVSFTAPFALPERETNSVYSFVRI